MLSLRLLTGAAFSAILACACSAPDHSASAVKSQPGTGGNLETDGSPDLGGSKNHTQPSGGKPGSGGSRSADEEEAGAGGASAGQAGALDEPAAAPPLFCDLDRTCSATCEQTKVHCGIELSPGYTCEYEGFNGATAEVSCGERAIIGTACCGGCGCTPVEVYFDGTYCWQGMPQCELENFHNQVFLAHLPTTSNATFSPPTDLPGSFYLGTAGQGGRAPSSQSGGSGGTNGGSGGASGAGVGAATPVAGSGFGGASGDAGTVE